MEKRTRFFALLLAAVLMFSVAACGKSTADSGDFDSEAAQTVETEAEAEAPVEEEVEEIDPIAAAQEKMENVTSMRVVSVTEMDMEIGAEGESMVMASRTTMDMTAFEDPILLKMDMTMEINMGASGDESDNMVQNVSAYAAMQEDGACMMYVFDGAEWQSMEISAEDLAQYDPGSEATSYLNANYHYEAHGMEQVNGADAYKYSGTITGEEMEEVLVSSGALDQLSELGFDASQLASLSEDWGGLSIDLWIDAETYYPVKYEIDMTTVMDSLMSSFLEEMGEEAGGITMSIPKMWISMTCSDFNEVEEFELPDIELIPEETDSEIQE